MGTPNNDHSRCEDLETRHKDLTNSVLRGRVLSRRWSAWRTPLCSGIDLLIPAEQTEDRSISTH